MSLNIGSDFAITREVYTIFIQRRMFCDRNKVQQDHFKVTICYDRNTSGNKDDNAQIE